jgi:hypothetical protein
MIYLHVKNTVEKAKKARLLPWCDDPRIAVSSSFPRDLDAEILSIFEYGRWNSLRIVLAT